MMGHADVLMGDPDADAATPAAETNTSTSETGERDSVLFSEQVRAEIEGSRDSRSRSRSTMATTTGPEGDETQEGDDDGGDYSGSMFYYIDDEKVGIAPGAVEPTAEAGSDNATETPADDNVDMDDWLEESNEPADAEADFEPAAPNDPAPDQMTRVLEHHDQMFQVEEESEDDYEEPLSYHSGDSDEYDMEHRPWLERTSIKRDIQELYAIKGMWNGAYDQARYRAIDRLGEGTFSSVYLAEDSLHDMHSNTYWTCEPDVEVGDKASITTRVALKKILVTSSPARVENELHILENLRGCRNVSPLISAFRDEDQIVIVLPYHACDDFRYFYRYMDPPKMRQYMTCLMRSLKDIHARGIVHRDVKPANFLFDYESGHGVLVDFGLAERYTPPRRPTCQHEPATRASLHGTRTKTNDTPTVEQAVYDARKRAKAGEGRIGFRQEDARPSIKTNRAGTRGFRAPEVLLKCPNQTVAIDVWSAGVILLSLLSHKFPVFNSTDDIEALMEIAALFGRSAMERCALLHNRTIMTNVPSVDAAPDSLSALILRLNPHLYTPHQSNPTAEEAMEHITAIDQALDLCSRLLRLDSTTRLTASAALRHAFLANEEDSGPDELLEPGDAKCGNLHSYTSDGQHQAQFGDILEDMRFGQGFPPVRGALCPEHEHWQQRSGVNPLGAAFGARVEEEYFQRVGFRLREEFLGWDSADRH
ncbi:Cell cycle serine/threonine-protein kinase hsk1 [Vanrija pseudolonga]|uniref:non-specific serine/threonine protein kinase n=1 Tax=Vanrija pseudolonga TaxID=143232 RepID=A0AAF0Y784_9TREE|nr:Cell cycle serine/threonine-protein kinase hsk1 [Vanrija pseudolonga]